MNKFFMLDMQCAGISEYGENYTYLPTRDENIARS